MKNRNRNFVLLCMVLIISITITGSASVKKTKKNTIQNSKALISLKKNVGAGAAEYIDILIKKYDVDKINALNVSKDGGRLLFYRNTKNNIWSTIVGVGLSKANGADLYYSNKYGIDANNSVYMLKMFSDILTNNFECQTKTIRDIEKIISQEIAFAKNYKTRMLTNEKKYIDEVYLKGIKEYSDGRTLDFKFYTEKGITYFELYFI